MRTQELGGRVLPHRFASNVTVQLGSVNDFLPNDPGDQAEQVSPPEVGGKERGVGVLHVWKRVAPPQLQQAIERGVDDHGQVDSPKGLVPPEFQHAVVSWCWFVIVREVATTSGPSQLPAGLAVPAIVARFLFAVLAGHGHFFGSQEVADRQTPNHVEATARSLEVQLRCHDRRRSLVTRHRQGPVTPGATCKEGDMR